jgi:hypothetical protein
MRTEGNERFLGTVRLNEQGVSRMKARTHLDALDQSGASCGRFELGVGGTVFLGTLWFASVRGISTLCAPFGEEMDAIESAKSVNALDHLPGVWADVAQVARLMLAPSSLVSAAGLISLIMRSDLPDVARAQLVRAIADTIHLAATFDEAKHDLPVECQPSSEVAELCNWFLNRGAEPVQPRNLRVGRWQSRAASKRQRLLDQDNAEELIREWRDAVRVRLTSRLTSRSGGHALTDTGRRYCEAMALPSGKGRNQTLTGVVVSLSSLRAQEQGTLVADLACILEQLARYHSGRGIDLATLNAVERSPSLGRVVNQLRVLGGVSCEMPDGNSLDLGDVSPWEGDAHLGE